MKLKSTAAVKEASEFIVKVRDRESSTSWIPADLALAGLVPAPLLETVSLQLLGAPQVGRQCASHTAILARSVAAPDIQTFG